ncbi:LysR family transcriptional regulator [Streptomyces endophyticus]|uniref:LysR family transcriptional regulator n=1 Tax=Streptomyces endophyticus TaxID=714166 RepID=A0ABU6F234_9ACTN|nr:LysR family transcriptional regulator [Streptomyces endophyticus]MEB8338065.1 LysR family transcriptional regulator [Streptomyces endophyticus]
MRTEQLEYIEAVTRLGSLRRAASELHISQPALSETVRNLERELGVALLDRHRSGAKVSDGGRELLPHIIGVLESVDRLRSAAHAQHHSSRMVRVGTVNAATVPLLAPAVRDFHANHPATQVEMVGSQQDDIHRGLREGRFDLGLVNYLEGDDTPPDLQTTELLRGRPVVCLRSDDPLAEQSALTPADLAGAPLIGMRTGYVMHRYAHRMFGGASPTFAYSTDGAELGKILVAEGLGVTLLPDFSVAGDPLERAGLITYRPLVDDTTRVLVVLQCRTGAVPRAVRDLHAALRARARTVGGAFSG